MMHGRLPGETTTQIPAGTGPLAGVARGLSLLNHIIIVFAALALIAACVILSYSVIGRALFQAAN